MWNLHVGDMVCQRDYVKAVKSQLNFSLPSMTTYIADQTDLAIAERIAPPPNFTCWRAVMFWNATLDIIHRVTAAIRVGPELAAVPTYIHHARGYTEEVTSFNIPFFATPSFFRVPLIGYLEADAKFACTSEKSGTDIATITPQRKVDVEISLSKGEVVKAGTLIGFPTLAIRRDPENYDRPLEFDPWRFYDALTDTIKLISLISFGYGTQNCSGSFLATESSKIVLAQLIVDYEMKFTPKRIGKPVDWPIGGQIMACIDTYVSFGQRTH
ncbi:cytochrome P450 [Phyllosticta citricarpa]|uniref:Cytochrome P450 n=1 Tax=Phyllosticta citricarpa TaxID=55181 RepID=A0ABR1LYM5_9PEZI